MAVKTRHIGLGCLRHGGALRGPSFSTQQRRVSHFLKPSTEKKARVSADVTLQVRRGGPEPEIWARFVSEMMMNGLVFSLLLPMSSWKSTFSPTRTALITEQTSAKAERVESTFPHNSLCNASRPLRLVYTGVQTRAKTQWSSFYR